MKKIGYSSLKRDYKTAKSIFKLIRKLSKHYFLLVITKVLLQIPIIPINLFIPALILDELLETQRKDFLIGLVILCAACNFIYSVIVNLLNKKIEIANIDLVMLLEQHLGEKIMGIDYEYLESPEILESKERAIYPIKELNAIGLMLKEFSSTYN